MLSAFTWAKFLHLEKFSPKISERGNLVGNDQNEESEEIRIYIQKTVVKKQKFLLGKLKYRNYEKEKASYVSHFSYFCRRKRILLPYQ